MEPKCFAVIFWNIHGKEGHGSPIEVGVAAETVRQMNRRWGAGTHRLEVVTDAMRWVSVRRVGRGF